MAIGPILRKELILTARRGATYTGRAAHAAELLLVIAAMEACAYAFEWDRSTVAAQANFALRAFAALAGVLMLLALMVAPMMVAPSIATERDKKSLDALLTTRLSGLEIVSGKLASGLLHFATAGAVGVPVLLGLSFAWGVDVRLVLLALAALAATAFASGAIAVWFSARARDPRKALGYAVLLVLGWAYAPLVIPIVLPRLWPAVSHWVSPVAWALLDTSPVGLLANVIGMKRRGTLVEATFRMIAWEVGIGLAVLAWTSLRFRAICRATEEREGRRWLRRLRRLTAPRRPPCGDDPVLWYEQYNTRGVGPLTRRFGQLVSVCILGGFAVAIYGFAEPAFGELLRYGYGAGAGATDRLELSPIARALASIKTPIAAPTGLARVEFNVVLRSVTAIVAMIYLIVLASFAAEGLVVERTKDTLSGLLATPLTGPEILRAKMLGAAWRGRGFVVLQVVLVSLGLLSGAVHPVGFAAALVSLALTTWFCIAVGTYGSLWSGDMKRASNLVTLPLTFAVFSAMLPIMLPSGMTSVLLGAASPAWHTYLSLVSYEDVRDAFRPGPYSPLAALGVGSGEGVGRVAVTCLLGWAAQGLLAWWYTRAALRRFDEAVGRPMRPPVREEPLVGRLVAPPEVAC
jgi:ABC-type Na+ efflux pump permease subunit